MRFAMVGSVVFCTVARYRRRPKLGEGEHGTVLVASRIVDGRQPPTTRQGILSVVKGGYG
jgi:hypothetical protein